MVGDAAVAASALRPFEAVLEAMDSISDIDEPVLASHGRVGVLLLNLKWVDRRRKSAVESLHQVLHEARHGLSHGVDMEFCNQSRNDYSVVVRGKQFEAPSSWILLGGSSGSSVSTNTTKLGEGGNGKKKKTTNRSVRKYRIPEVERLSDGVVDMDVERRAACVEIIRMLSEDFLHRVSSWRLLIYRSAELDVFVSLLDATEAISKRAGLPICFPNFTPNNSKENTCEMHILGGWNPILAASAQKDVSHQHALASRIGNTHAPKVRTIVQNDVHLDDEEDGCCLLLTGPNMSGKSTMLRLSGICVIMAQIGAPVPADGMDFSVVDQLFSRIGAEDCIEAGESTFMMEMNQTNFLLRNATRSSLVLVDELGRGTSTFDGLAIAHAVLSHLARLRCRTLFSTHYHKLVEDFSEHGAEQVVIAHMECNVRNAAIDIQPTYKLRNGISPLGSCGLLIARTCGLPRMIVDRADAKSSEMGTAISMNAGRRRSVAVQARRNGAHLDDEELGWICDMTDDPVLSHCAEPDDAFYGDFRDFWVHIRKHLRTKL